MTLYEIIEQLHSNLNALVNLRVIFEQPKAKLLVGSIKGLVSLFEKKLGIQEQPWEEELTNGDIFKCDFEDKSYFYACVEMPNKSKKWFKGTKGDRFSSKVSNWTMINFDPTLQEANDEHMRNTSSEYRDREESRNIYRPTNSFRRD